jgi:hypothetical protein
MTTGSSTDETWQAELARRAAARGFEFCVRRLDPEVRDAA